MKKVQHIFYAFFLVWQLATVEVSQAQTTEQDSIPSSVARDSATFAKTDTIVMQTENGDIETTIFYTAEDSMIMDVIQKKVYLYGKAKVEYGDLTLTADHISVDWTSNMMSARGTTDSTGKYVGRPFFVQQEDEYLVDSMDYNFKSKKGIIHNMVTKEGEGYMATSLAKRTEDAIYMKSGTYTTCNLAHPHFYIQAHKLKVIPEKEIISGPFHMVISDVKTPIGFPLAFFPIMDKAKSGIIFPQFGQQLNRGFYLYQGGYYWATNDYMGMQIVGDIYTNGSYRLTYDNEYTKRYSYNGGLTTNFSRIRDGFGAELPYSDQFNITWKHSTLTKRNYRFSANVNASSNSYYRQNSYSSNAYQSNIFNSNVSFYTAFRNTPFSMSVTMRHDQNVQTKEMNLTLPDVNLYMNRIYPFKGKGSGRSWYEQISISYSGNTKYFISNRITQYPSGTDSIYNISGDSIDFILRNAKWGMTHDITIPTTFKILKYFNVNPSFSYREYWYPEKLVYSIEPDTNVAVVSGVERGFTRASSYSFSTNVKTWIYGKWRFGNGFFRVLKHSVNPSLSYTFIPANASNYVFFEQSRNYKGDLIAYNTFNSFIYGSPSRNMQNILGFEISNILEGMFRNRKDTTDSKDYTIVKLLDNFGASGRYDFTADSLNLYPFNIYARTQIFKDLVSLNFTGTLDPYIYIADTNATNTAGIRVNRFAVDNGEGLARLVNYNFSVGTRLGSKKNSKPGYKPKTPEEEREYERIRNNPDMYVDFNVPWDLQIRYTLNYNKTGLREASITQSIDFGGQITLTPKWALSFNSGYDIKNRGLTYTSIKIDRDLHCWQMSMMVVPFGPRQSYIFSFTAKSSILQTLKLNKRSGNYFGSF